MTLVKKTFTIELTEEEITLLHRAANDMKKSHETLLDSEDIDTRMRAGKVVADCRHIRNALAGLVGSTYMGNDI